MAFNIADLSRIDPKQQLLDLDRCEFEESLYDFLKAAWPYIDPSPWKDGWHIQAIARHLQAVVDGEIRRLIINVPPRHCKSLLTSVAFPAWTWAQPNTSPTSGPGVPFLYASYADKLSLRDSVKCRRLIESPWYRERWEDRFKLTSDQNTKSRFTNDQGGERLITSIGAGVTGEGGNCFVAGTRVSTPNGQVNIEDIRTGDAVLAFDTLRGKVVTSKVVATSKRKTNDICELYEVSGHQFRCTPDHPIYSPGRGYIRAAEMGRGDRLLVEARQEGNYSSTLRQLRKENGQSTLRAAQGPESGKSGRLLQQEMLLSSSRNKKFSNVPMVPSVTGLSACEILLYGLQRKRQQSASHESPSDASNAILHSMWEGICRLWCRLLLSKMFERGTFSADGWLWKFEVSGTGKIFESIHGNAMRDNGEGSFSLRSMQRQRGSAWESTKEILAGESPHRREHSEQSAGESHNVMRSVSSESSQWHTSHISNVVRHSGESIEVYDIQVEGQSNFFAESLLVHNCIVIDDPNSANDVASEATIQTTIDWWQTAMPTRLNDMATGAFVIIQQRLKENDLTGHIQENEADGWVQLILPARYEPERTTILSTSIGWSDPRTEPGELLWPEKFSDESLKRLEKTMGPFISAGQLQQRPEPAGGGIIKREWWKLWDRETWPPMDFVLGCLDTAYTEDTMNDPSGMLVWGIFSGDYLEGKQAQVTRSIARDGRPLYLDRRYSQSTSQVMCMHAWDDHLELHDLIARVAKTCVSMKVDLLLIENKSSGISVAQEIRRLYSNERFGVQLFDPKSQDKTARLYSVQHLFAEGLIHAPDRIWADKVITQVGLFPKGKHDEFVDLTSMGLRYLRDNGLIARAPEREAELESLTIYPGNQAQPLYSV